MLIYKLVLRPILQYASPIWGHAAYSNIKMLESAQNKIIKIITDSPWYVRNDDIRVAIKLKTLKCFFKKIATKFFNNIDNHTNRAIARIEKYVINPSFNRPRNDENKIDRERQRAGASAQNEWQRGTEANMRKKPKTGEGRGNKRRQSQPGRDVGGAKHETGRNGQNDKRERTEAGAAKEGNKESEQNKISMVHSS
ncbi:hypothetical protein TNCV_1300171 [Trichonephila clavipes]|nr:hypothetical protein TNCV_1300171 [Trichonephila clavipes]